MWAKTFYLHNQLCHEKQFKKFHTKIPNLTLLLSAQKSLLAMAPSSRFRSRIHSLDALLGVRASCINPSRGDSMCARRVSAAADVSPAAADRSVRTMSSITALCWIATALDHSGAHRCRASDSGRWERGVRCSGVSTKGGASLQKCQVAPLRVRNSYTIITSSKVFACARGSGVVENHNNYILHE